MVFSNGEEYDGDWIGDKRTGVGKKKKKKEIKILIKKQFQESTHGRMEINMKEILLKIREQEMVKE